MENMALDKKINILKAADLIGEKKPSKEKINQLYTTHIKPVMVDDKGKTIDTYVPDSLNLYLYQDGEKIKGYILPINSRGLWGKIQGYLAFEPDGQTVSGFSVFSHSETPGLGGEIESAWFQKNFKGKKMLSLFDDLLDMPLNHYQLQLSFYQILFEQIGLKVEGRKIIWLKPDGEYDMYDTEDYTGILKEYLKHNKV